MYFITYYSFAALWWL